VDAEDEENNEFEDDELEENEEEEVLYDRDSDMKLSEFVGNNDGGGGTDWDRIL